jgi:hypothetical protein
MKRRRKKRWRTEDTPESKCPHCFTPLNARTQAAALPSLMERSEDLELSVCIRCGGLLKFASDQSVVALSPHEVLRLALHEPESYAQIVKMQAYARSLSRSLSTPPPEPT